MFSVTLTKSMCRLFKLLQDVDQMLEGAGQSVEFPDHHGVKHSSARITEQSIQLRSMALGPANPRVDVFAVAGEPSAGKTTQLIELSVTTLVGSADRGIERGNSGLAHAFLLQHALLSTPSWV